MYFHKINGGFARLYTIENVMGAFKDIDLATAHVEDPNL